MIQSDYRTTYDPSTIPSSAQTQTKKINPAIEKFKLELTELWRDSSNMDCQQLSIALFNIIPKTLETEDVVKCVFEECKSVIPLFLDAILMLDPSFSLSSYDKIRRAIIEDRDHRLTNNIFLAMMRESGLENDEEKLTACYDLAYLRKHPYIYRLSQTPVSTSDYTLNFLWVNLNPQNRIQNVAQNIFKDGLDLSENAECIKNPTALRALEKSEQSLKDNDLENWEKIKESFTYRISKWADIHPHAEINLWYDSALVTQNAQQKTFEMMRDIAQSRGVNLRLRDIRQLPNLQGEILNSLHPGTPVYYRVDLLKALIADYMLSSPKERAKYCVISDVDVEPMTSQQMFDQRTLDYLSSNGYVFNRAGSGNTFENSFFIFNKEKEGLQKIHYKSIIQDTASTLTSLRECPRQNVNFPGAQFVFSQYPNFLRKMKEDEGLEEPRKMVKCPISQFNGGGSFPKTDFRAEKFRFIGNSDIPVTINGRNWRKNYEDYIDSLVTWKAEPLDPCQ